MGWQPPRVGALAGSVLPFISLGPVVGSCRRRHGSCLFWGVTFWQSEKLFAAALNLHHPRQCLPRPLRHWYHHHLRSVPRLPPPQAPSTSASARQAQPFWVWSCCFLSGTLCPSFKTRGLDSFQGALFLGPLCPEGWHPVSCLYTGSICFLLKFLLSQGSLDLMVVPGLRTL